MKEIKFRAWNDRLEKMIYGPTDDNPQPSWVLCLQGAMGLKVMQYTGLKDKNEQEIYEGDILSYELIFYAGKKLTLPVTMPEIYSHLHFDEFSNSNIDMETIEIIGDIFKSPELLTT